MHPCRVIHRYRRHPSVNGRTFADTSGSVTGTRKSNPSYLTCLLTKISFTVMGSASTLEQCAGYLSTQKYYVRGSKNSHLTSYYHPNVGNGGHIAVEYRNARCHNNKRDELRAYIAKEKPAMTHIPNSEHRMSHSHDLKSYPRTEHTEKMETLSDYTKISLCSEN